MQKNIKMICKHVSDMRNYSYLMLRDHNIVQRLTLRGKIFYNYLNLSKHSKNFNDLCNY